MSEEGETSDIADGAEVSDSHASVVSDDSGSERDRSSSSHKAKKKRSKYSSLKSRFKKLEALVTNAFSRFSAGASGSTAQSLSSHETNSGETVSSVKDTETNSSAQNITVSDDTVSIHSGNTKFDSEDEIDNDKLSEDTRKCLFDMFGEDAMVKKKTEKVGICLDKAQIEVLESSFRCKEPNFVTAFSEDNVDLFPVDTETEKFLKVPSLDALVDSCLTARYGNKASFVKSKGKVLYTQPCKMIDKIGFKGQHAARMGIIMQCYVQQSLGNFLQFLESDDFVKSEAIQQIRDIFAMSTKVLDQLGRSGALHHIARRTVAMTDTGLYEQHGSYEFTNLPLSGEGVFGPELEPLLKARKEKRKQIEELIPNVQLKRKFDGTQKESNKRPASETKQSEKSFTASDSNWKNFRIPKVTGRGGKQEAKGASRGGRGGYNSYSKKPGRGRLEKPADK